MQKKYKMFFFITIIFLSVSLGSIFFYKKLFSAIIPTMAQESVQDLASVQDVAQEPAQIFPQTEKLAQTQIFAKNQEQVLARDQTPVQVLNKNQKLAPAQDQVSVQNFSPALAQEPDMVLDKDFSPVSVQAPTQVLVKFQEQMPTPVQVLNKDQKLAPAQDQVSAQNFSPSLAQEPYLVLDKDMAFDKKQIRTIKVKNNITADMLKYRHWTGTYSPTQFKISIDNRELEAGLERDIAIENNTFFVSYQYVFMNGYKKGHRIVTFDVDKDISEINLTFSWKTKWHILSEQASPIQVEEVSA